MNYYYFDTLPIHPQPEPDESLTSYLIRLAEKNYIKKGDSSLTLTRLHESWRNIQSQPPEEGQEFTETTEE